MIRAANRPGRASVATVFLVAFVVYAYFMPRWADWNIDSRLDLVHSIVDYHSLQIDRIHWNTWDKAEYRGHFYSDKAPGTAIIGVAVYGAYVVAKQAPMLGGGIQLLLHNGAWRVPIKLGETATQNEPVAKGRNLGGCQRSGGGGNVQYIPWGNRLVPPMRDWALSKYVVSVGSVSLLSALFVAFFFWFVSLFSRRRLVPWLLTGLYAFCSVALPYSTNFYSHQLAAAALFTAFALLYLVGAGRGARWHVPVAGFLVGAAVFTEYTVLIIAVIIGVYALWIFRRRLSSAAAAAAGALVPLAGLLVYNARSFSGPLDSGYSHDFCWSSAQAAGFQGFTYPHLQPLFDLTFGSFRGLFYMSPFLLLAVPGAVIAYRRGLRAEVTVCLVTTVLFIVALSAYWGWNGGQVDGPRYLVPIVPFAAFPCAFLLDSLASVPVLWVVVGPAAAWSAFATWSEFLGGDLFPSSWLRDPLFQYSLPHLGANEIAPNAGLFFGLAGWQSLLPLLLLLLLCVSPTLPRPARDRESALRRPGIERAG